MSDPTTHPSLPPVPGRQVTGLAVSPALDRSDVAFLAGFAAGPVRDHAGAVVVAGVPARVWPGQPRSVAPLRPCADGCCLVLVPRRGGHDPGLVAQWLRFLVPTFLAARHRVDGRLVVPVRGGGSEVVLVDAGEVFEGVLEAADPWEWPSPRRGPDDPAGGWPS